MVAHIERVHYTMLFKKPPTYEYRYDCVGVSRQDGGDKDSRGCLAIVCLMGDGVFSKYVQRMRT